MFRLRIAHRVSKLRTFSSTSNSIILPFDTLKFVQELKSVGFTNEQSEIVLQAIKQSTQEISSRLTDTIPVEELHKSMMEYKFDCAQLKSEIHTLERTDFTKLKHDSQSTQAEIDKLSQRAREEIYRLRAGTQLDLNLERARLFDDYSEMQSKLKDVETKMQQESEQIRALLQQVKFDTLRTLLTTASTLGLVILGYMRLFK